MPYAELSDKARLYYEVHGEGPGLVLIPGLAVGLDVWGGFPKALGKFFTTVTYDPRGLGRSELPPDTGADAAGIDRMARDVRELITGLGLGPAHVMGVSFGGIVAQFLTAEHPGVVDRLVLVTTAGRLGRWTRRLLSMYDILTQKLTPEEYVEVVTPLIVSPEYFRSEPKRMADLEKRLLYDPSSLPAIRAQINALRELDARRPRIDKPCLILAGSRDVITPPFCAEAIHERTPGSRLVVLEGGHSCLIERTEEGLVAILGFLRQEVPETTS